MKLIVYTAIIGEIDRLWTPNPSHQDVKHIAFVDSRKHEVGSWAGDPPSISPGTGNMIVHNPIWEQHIVDVKWDNRRTARHYKTMPHLYMPDADIWLWVDGNARARRHPMDIVEDYLKDYEFLTLKHPDRQCSYVESMFCSIVNKDRRDVLEAQNEHYKKLGFPRDKGLVETRAVIRRNTTKIRLLDEAWWSQIETWSVRDQVSLPFVVWSMDMKIGLIPGRCWPGNKDSNWYYIIHGAQ